MVILDKSYLDASKKCDVQRALNGQAVLITFELIYEIMTNSKKKDPREYLDKLTGLDLVGSRPLVKLVNIEVAKSQRVNNVLDPVASKRLLDFVNNGQGVGVIPDVGSDVEDFFEKAEPRRLRDGLDGMWKPQFEDTFSQITRADLVANARNYRCMMGQLIGKGIAAEHHMTQQPTPGWLIYEWERLRNFWAFQFRLNGAQSCSLPDKKLANDLLDLHYLTFLPHVDAIATNDTKSIVPLAEAFGHADLTIIRPLAGKMKV